MASDRPDDPFCCFGNYDATATTLVWFLSSPMSQDGPSVGSAFVVARSRTSLMVLAARSIVIGMGRIEDYRGQKAASVLVDDVDASFTPLAYGQACGISIPVVAKGTTVDGVSDPCASLASNASGSMVAKAGASKGAVTVSNGFCRS